MSSWLDMRKKLPGRAGEYIHAVNMEVEVLVTTLTIHNFRVYIIDGSKIIDESSFFNEVAPVLEFPAYFGHGWASWDDCLGDFGHLVPQKVAIIWNHADQTFAADAQTFLQAVCDLQGLACNLALRSAQGPYERGGPKWMEVFLLGQGRGFEAMSVL